MWIAHLYYVNYKLGGVTKQRSLCESIRICVRRALSANTTLIYTTLIRNTYHTYIPRIWLIYFLVELQVWRIRNSHKEIIKMHPRYIFNTTHLYYVNYRLKRSIKNNNKPTLPRRVHTNFCEEHTSLTYTIYMRIYSIGWRMHSDKNSKR